MKKKTPFLTGIITLIGVLAIIYGNDIQNFVAADDKSVSDKEVSTFEEQTTQVSGEIQVYFLNVGQADAVLIRDNDSNMLIDAGNNADGEKLVSFFDSLGIDSFKYVVATHAHEDHIGGMDDIIENFEIDNFYMPDVVTTTKTFEEVLDALDNSNLTYDTPEIGYTFNLGEAHFEVIYVGDDENNLNDTSIVLHMTFGNVKFLFTGDLQEDKEKDLLDKNIKSDVLKVGHHGSDTSTSEKFLKAVDPKYAVIEVGKNNIYNHPSDITLNRFKNYGIEVYRTDLDGTILFRSDGTDITIQKLNTDLDG